MNAESENGQLEKQILDEYISGVSSKKSQSLSVLGSPPYGYSNAAFVHRFCSVYYWQQAGIRYKGVFEAGVGGTGIDVGTVYKTKAAEPLVKKQKSLVKLALARCFDAMDNYYKLNVMNDNLHRTNERLARVNEKLKDENETLRAENKDYKLLRKVFGRKQIDNLLEQSREKEKLIGI